MSMREYAVSEYGMILSDETIHLLASKLCKDFAEDDYKDYIFDYIDEIMGAIDDYIVFYTEFDGEAFVIDNTGGDNQTKPPVYFDYDTVFFLPLRKYPTLFKTQYRGIQSIIAEMRERIGPYLPEEFDYRNNIRHIVGTYFG